MPSEPRAQRLPRIRASVGALLGLGIVLGWGLEDAAVFAASGDPAAALDLLPGIVQAALVGLVLGALSARSRILGLVVLAILAQAVRIAADAPSPALEVLPLSVLLFLATWNLATIRREPRDAVGALLLGAGLAVVPAWAQAAWLGEGSALPVPMLGVHALLGMAALARGRTRLVLAVLALASTALLLARDARRHGRPSRPDLAPPEARATPGSPSLLLIVLDTVRADRMSLYGHARETTPGLTRLAEASMTRFDQARSTSSWTLPSHASLFTGLLPSEHGVSHPRDEPEGTKPRFSRPGRLAPGTRTLAELLHERGYRTGAIVANHMMASWSGLDVGFEHYDDRTSAYVRRYEALGQIGRERELLGHVPYRNAERIGALAMDWLEARRAEDPEAPTFLFLNYMDAHNPYLPPAPFDRRFGDARPTDPIRPRDFELFGLLYDRELAYLDHELTRFLEDAEERGLLEETLVVITSDHGEAFGEHGTWMHDWTLYDELVRVPLLVRPPGGRREAVSAEPISGADVFDLILRELGLAAEDTRDGAPTAEWFHAPSLPLEPGIPSPPRESLARDLAAWVEGMRKEIVSSTGVVEAFDLARDPGEVAPLPLAQEERAELLERARAWWAANPPRGNEGASEDVDDATLERLQGLGYAGGED